MTKPEQNPDAMTEPVATPAEPPSPGQSLRAGREARGLSQAQVGESLHLTVHYINALENDQYQKLPGRTFAKGYVKVYARLLELDADELVARFERLMDAREGANAGEARSIARPRKRDQSGCWLLVAACLLFVALGAAWWFGRDTTAPSVVLPRVALEETANTGPDGPAPLTPADAGLVPDPAFGATAPVAGEAFGNTESGVAANAAQSPAEPTNTPAPGAQASAAAPEAPALSAANPAATNPAAANPPAAEELALEESTSGVAGMPPGQSDDAASAELADATPGDGSSAAAGTLPDAPGALALQREEAASAAGGRQIRLDGEGDDTLVVTFSGTSWLAVRNGADSALFNDNLHDGDELTIRGEAPFNLVIGDAHQVQVQFNARAVDLSPRIRADRTARLSLQP